MNPSTESPGSDGPRLGRPRDGALTDRVLSGAQDVVIEQGPDRLSADALAAVTGVSRAAIYRRWPDTAALLAEIVTRCRPVPAIPDTGSLRGDLVGLLEPWTRALDRDERLVATVLGRARHSPALRAGLEAAVVHPLDAAVATAVDRHVARGHEVPAAGRVLLGRLLLALWWERYVSEPAATTDTVVGEMVDRALLPVVRST